MLRRDRRRSPADASQRDALFVRLTLTELDVTDIRELAPVVAPNVLSRVADRRAGGRRGRNVGVAERARVRSAAAIAHDVTVKRGLTRRRDRRGRRIRRRWVDLFNWRGRGSRSRSRGRRWGLRGFLSATCNERDEEKRSGFASYRHWIAVHSLVVATRRLLHRSTHLRHRPTRLASDPAK